MYDLLKEFSGKKKFLQGEGVGWGRGKTLKLSKDLTEERQHFYCRHPFNNVLSSLTLPSVLFSNLFGF